MPDPKVLFDHLSAFVKKAVAAGIALDTALDAFGEKMFPTFTAIGAEDQGEAFGSLPPEFQAELTAVHEAVLSGS